jgi:uncharacterized membrane protein
LLVIAGTFLALPLGAWVVGFATIVEGWFSDARIDALAAKGSWFARRAFWSACVALVLVEALLAAPVIRGGRLGEAGLLPLGALALWFVGVWPLTGIPLFFAGARVGARVTGASRV